MEEAKPWKERAGSEQIRMSKARAIFAGNPIDAVSVQIT